MALFFLVTTFCLQATLDPILLQTLVTRYAPLVKLHETEKYFPSSVEWFVQRCSLESRNPNVIIKEKGLVTLNDLSAYNNPSAGSEFYLNPQGDSIAFAGQPLVYGSVQAPCYANVIETAQGAVIQYIFFYPFNGPFLGPAEVVSLLAHFNITFGSHEGDWEHINAYLVNDKGNWELDSIYFARHVPESDGGYVSAQNLEYSNGHPIVYASKFGHASHPHHITSIDTKSFDITSKNGPEWKCWEHIVHLDANQVWLSFKGRWGSTSNSPETPSKQRWWRSQANQRIPITTISATPGPMPGEKSRASKNFDLRIPTNIKQLYFWVEHPLASTVTFALLRKTFFGGTAAVFTNLKGLGTVTNIPNEKSDLYIGRVNLPGATQNTSDLLIHIDGLERQ
jgi:hypothetical protein